MCNFLKSIFKILLSEKIKYMWAYFVMAALLAELKFSWFGEMIHEYVIILRVFSVELGWVTCDASPEPLKSYTTWLPLTLPKCHGQPWVTMLMPTRNNAESSQLLSLNICESHNFFTKIFSSTVLGFKTGCFLLLEPAS